jgi:hypothetical protein
MRTPAETAELEAERVNIGYRDPPDGLVPAKGPDEEPAAWERLRGWFEGNTKNADRAILVFFASKAKCSIGQAYIYTDNWAKRRVWTDEDGEYMSFN